MKRMTQAERNRQVHEEVIREFRSLTQEERVQRLIECGILTPEGKLAPRYGGPGAEEFYGYSESPA
jgi:hypothetical protein